MFAIYLDQDINYISELSLFLIERTVEVELTVQLYACQVIPVRLYGRKWGEGFGTE